MTKAQIAIDGPAGAGKSTVARKVAQKLGFLFVSSGLVYRGLAFGTLKNSESADEPSKIAEWIKKHEIEFRPIDGEARIFLDGEDISEKLHTPEITERASKLAAIPQVRASLLPIQRNIAQKESVVMEGRDIGSVVFPETPYKFYIDANEAERVKRRYEELKQRGYNPNQPGVSQAIKSRDELDSGRSSAPLKVPEGATVLDTTNIGVEEAVGAVLKKLREMGLKADNK